MENSVSTTAILAMVFTAALTILGPVAALIIWKIKTKAKLIPALVGALTFVVFALLLEQIFHYIFLVVDSPVSRAIQSNTWLYGVYGGMMAGMFEETGRFFAFTVILKKWKEKKTAITYGIGHGGVESILVVGLAYISNLAYTFMINSGGMDALMQTLPQESKDAVTSLTQTLITTPAPTYLAGGIERFSAVILHIGLSVLVFYAARQKGKRYFFPIAILIHAVVDFFAVIMSTNSVNIWLIELVVFVLGAAVFVFGIKLYHQYPEEETLFT